MKVKSCLSTKTPNSIEKYLPKGLGVMSAISLMLFMSFAQPGYAGNAKNPSSSEVNFDSTSSVMAPEMVVTATKSGINVSDAPASVSVITSENIETKNVRRAEEALTGQAGVYIKGAGDHAPSDNSGTVVYMRGIPGLGRTAVLLDGQSLNDPFSGGVNWSGIFADELDKIEVVRGPFSSLYGGNAISGVINFITKAPTKSEIIANAGYGSNNLFSGTIVYRNKFDRIGLSLGYGHEQSNGYAGELTVKTATAGTGTTPATGWTPTTNTLGAQAYLVGDKGDRWWNKDNVEMKLFYDLTEYSKVSLRAAWNKHETGFDGFNSYLRDTTGNTVISGSVGITDGAAKKFTLSETDFLLGENGAENFKINLGYETRLGDELRIKADAGYLNTGYWYVSQLTGATSKSGPGKYVDIPNNRYYISLQATQPLFGNQLLTVGINANQDAVHKREYNLADWQNHGDRGTIRYSVDGKNTTYGFFAQDELYLLDNLTLYLGARYDT
ncbi:MAG: TonB-dependent receptor [Chlorobiales bacterium]|nr:TonB-dependent receptor [Chlorobiales bacterium]